MKVIFFLVMLFLFFSTKALADYKVKFSEDKYQDERKKIIELHANDIQDIRELEHNIESYKFLIDKYDINGDGIKDIIVFFNGSYYCGAHGCLTQIYLGNTWKPVFNIYTYQNVTILPHKHSGFNDIKLEISEKPVFWYWNGEAYQISKSISNVVK